MTDNYAARNDWTFSQQKLKYFQVVDGHNLPALSFKKRHRHLDYSKSSIKSDYILSFFPFFCSFVQLSIIFHFHRNHDHEMTNSSKTFKVAVVEFQNFKFPKWEKEVTGSLINNKNLRRASFLRYRSLLIPKMSPILISKIKSLRVFHF